MQLMTRKNYIMQYHAMPHRANLTKHIAILHSYGHHFRYHVDMRMSRKHLERAAACLAKENRPVFRLSFATQGSSFPQLQICHAPCRTFLHPLCHFKLPTWKPGKRSTFGCVLLMKQSIVKCSGFSANIHHSCHKGQLGPFAQCDLVHTGQNRTMQYFCTQA